MNISEWKEKYLAEDLVYDYKLAKQILEDFKQCFKEVGVIVYGAGTLGTVMMKILNTLAIKPVAVVDKNHQKYVELSGMPVEKIETLTTYIAGGEKYQVLVAINHRLFYEVKGTLNKYGYADEQISSGAAMQRVLQSSICTCNLYEGNALNSADCFECAVAKTECEALCKHSQKLSGYEKGGEKVCSEVITTGIIMGQTCTLKCRHCNESLPFIKENRVAFVPKETILADMQKLASACEFLGHVELVGGEPFLHKEIKDVLLELLAIRNIGLIHVVTNGTVVPNDEVCKILQNPRIVVYMSNYENALNGKLAQNVMETRRKLAEWNVCFKYGKNQNWLDFASFEEVNDAEAVLERRYHDCCFRNCHRVFQGKIYSCPHHYGGVMTKNIVEEEIISLHDCSRDELVERLNAWKEKKYIAACKQCKMPYRAETVSAAIQVQ